MSREAFCNSSPFTLRDLRSRANQQQLKNDFILYLNGFSYQQIAVKLNRPPKSIDNALQRIKHKIEALRTECDE